jgi:hypothetical protein
MNIEEAKKLKRQMESDINFSINKFMEDTGLLVTYIDLDFMFAGNITDKVQNVRVEVELP